MADQLARAVATPLTPPDPSRRKGRKSRKFSV